MSNWIKKILAVITALALFYLLWLLLTFYRVYPQFILPNPSSVFKEISFLFSSEEIWPHLLRTVSEIGWGFAIGTTFGALIGYLMAKSHLLKITLTPYIIALQSIPTVAITPLLILWFGSGIESKIIVCSLIVFFPVMVNTSAAITTINPNFKNLFKSYNATSWQVFKFLEVPSSLSFIYPTIKISVVLALIGAIVGEFMGSDKGLGFLINTSLGFLDSPKLFAVIMILAVLGILLYLIASTFEKQLSVKKESF